MQSDCMRSNYRWVQFGGFFKRLYIKEECRGASSSEHCQVGLCTDGCNRLPIHISGGNSDGSLLCLHLLSLLLWLIHWIRSLVLTTKWSVELLPACLQFVEFYIVCKHCIELLTWLLILWFSTVEHFVSHSGAHISYPCLHQRTTKFIWGTFIHYADLAQCRIYRKCIW